MSFNKTVLMSGAKWFDDAAAINPFMNKNVAVDKKKAQAEHDAIRDALAQAGVKVITVEPPEMCQDGVYTANWALIRGNKAVLSRLPSARTAEEPYAAQVLTDLGKTVIYVPDGLKFSGQGDALPCGNYLFCGSGYRSDPEAQEFAAEALGYERVQLKTVPKTNWLGRPVINKYSGWPDSYFYDIDLALSVLREPTNDAKGLIAWCPDAFTPESQELLRAFDEVKKIEVSLHEAKKAFACNLVSNGETVIMGARASNFIESLKEHGLIVITPEIIELSKGGGYIRCTTLTLDND
jgi:N-dimethylarginine dimethylaminohydrolase